MKKLVIAVIIFTASMHHLQAQGTAESQANQVAQKMKDSLSLSDALKSQVATATLKLESSRIRLKQQFAGTKSLEYYLRMVEEDRDTQYKAILPQDKYLLYLQKRSNLISSN